MDVSVIIVSYEVKYFLEQCLASVMKSLIPIKGEVWVIDNASTDGTISYLEEKYSTVHFIRNKENVGFAKANNQVLPFISGKYVHYLNPDTILPEDFYVKSIHFFESHPQAGAIGVKMIDGSGNYLKESKRGYPNYWSTFCKMSGICKLFPHSKMFSGYYQGFLPKDKSNQVSVLSGASMMITKKVIDKTGAFDERFFMYAEDIDLSIRILQNGYEVWYYPEITMIHFKGESTRKNTQNRRIFYHTMIDFVKKYEKGTISYLKAKVLSLIVGLLVKTSEIKSKLNRIEHDSIENDIKFTEINELKELSNILTSKKKMPEFLLFKEGEKLTYKIIIDEISRNKNGFSFFLKGKNTTSIVGSTSAKKKGFSRQIEETKL